MRVIWTSPALADVEEIQDFIAAESPAAASRLVDRLLDRTASLLSTNPMLGGPGRVPGTRELVISGTAYIVAYRITNQVEILAIVHGAREWPEDFE